MPLVNKEIAKIELSVAYLRHLIQAGNSIPIMDNLTTDVEITDLTKGYILTDANGSGHRGRLQFYRIDDNNWTAQITQIS